MIKNLSDIQVARRQVFHVLEHAGISFARGYPRVGQEKVWCRLVSTNIHGLEVASFYMCETAPLRNGIYTYENTL